MSIGTNEVQVQKIQNIPFTRGQVTYALICSFFAWLLSVYDYILFGTLLPVIALSFHWSTTKSLQIATFVSIGTFIITFLVGPLTDYFGRKNALMVTTFGAAISSGLTGFTMSPWYLIAIRSFSGLGYSEQAVNATYLSEVMPPGRRGFVYSFVQGGWPLGVLLASLMVAVLEPSVGWRGVFWIATFPALVIVALWTRLKESPRYLQVRQIRKLLKTGRNKEAIELAAEYNIDSEKMNKSSIRQMFEPGIRRHSIFLCLAFLFNWMAVQVFAVLSTTVLVNGKHISFSNSLILLILSNALGYVGYVAHGFVGDKIGRRATIIIAWIVGSIFYGIMLFVAQGFTAVIITYSLGLFFLIGSASAYMSYFSESFPTRMRGTATSVVNSMGPIGAILGSAVFAAVSASGTVSNGAIVAGAIPMLISGFLMFGTRAIKPGMKLESISQ
ncbi:MFS transporter [Alicyclobacillus dauci]|uniref:MFS transporter n=1 Tax=Alicyclobacillus dauci TaxID=1475485 RepID=A0ABY6Z0X4_9BACL|nr:MFS transporter [Alicyclobacillus dauci]WAH36466.1 MFS transporter [Alicyclobacillus dauci]